VVGDGIGGVRSHDPSSVLVFDVDAAGVKQPAASARCELRLVELPGRRESRPAAVLVLRALTWPRLRACVRALRAADGTIAPEILCTLLAEQELPEAASSAPLTDRELDVLRLLADGSSTRDIAKQLSYSERTVKNIVRDLLVKLNCRTRAHAVAFAARRGVI
jgi:DNA-binding NarL/FixJ family response regulator